MGFGNLRIVSCKHTPIDAPYGIRKSWSFISTIRTVKKEISWHFIFITTAEDCVSESSKLCLNLCSKDDTCLHVIMASNTGVWEGLYSTPPPPCNFLWRRNLYSLLVTCWNSLVAHYTLWNHLLLITNRSLLLAEVGRWKNQLLLVAEFARCKK